MCGLQRCVFLTMAAIVAVLSVHASTAQAQTGRVYCYNMQNVYSYTGVTTPSGTLISPNGSFTDPNSWNGAYSNVDPETGNCSGKLPPGPQDTLIVGVVADQNGDLLDTTIGGGGTYYLLDVYGAPVSSGVTLTLQTGGSTFSGGLTANGGQATIQGGLDAVGGAALGSSQGFAGQYTIAGGTLSSGVIIQEYGPSTTVNVAAGGGLSAPEVVVDGASTSLIVDGTVNASSYLTVGQNASGSMTIDKGGSVTSGNGFIGGFPGSSGTVTVDGKWTTTGYLFVGQEGTGSLTVENGGQVVTGDFMAVGDGPGTSTLNIVTGGKVSVTPVSGLPGDLALLLAEDPASTANVTVAGAGSTLAINGALNVGYAGDATLTVGDGATVNVTGTIIRLGRFAGSLGVLTLNGAGSSFSFLAGSTFQVGNAGNGVLTVDQGFQLNTGAAAITIGALAGGSGTATVQDSGTTWTVGGSMTIGDAGTGQLNVAGGGSLVLQGSEFHLGESAGGVGALSLSGSASSITFPSVSTFEIGEAGTGNLMLNQGFQLNTSGADVTIGADAGGAGTAAIADASTSWTIGGNLTIGDSGNGKLTVSGGGAVTFNGNELDIAKSQGGVGLLALSGGSSSLTYASGSLFQVGDAGTGDLQVNQGFQLNTANAAVILGAASGASGTAELSDPGTTWTVGGPMTIGYFGTGKVTVSGGASLVVQGSDLYLGKAQGGSGTLVLDGAGSSLVDTNTMLHVGEEGTGELDLQNGASLDESGQDFTLGLQYTGTGTIRVLSGGSLKTGALTLGGAGEGNLVVGGGSSAGSLTVDGNTVIGGSATGIGHLAIGGAGAQATFQGYVTVGASGYGLLGLLPNASATIQDDLILGQNADSIAAVQVDQASTLTVQGNIYDGQNGNATLTVANGSTLNAAGDFVMNDNGPGTAGSTLSVSDGGVVNVAGSGGLTVAGNLATAPPLVMVQSGGQVYVIGGVSITGVSQAIIVVDGQGSVLSTNALTSVDPGAFVTVSNGGYLNLPGNCSCIPFAWGAGNFILVNNAQLVAPSGQLGSGGTAVASLSATAGASASFAQTLNLFPYSVVNVTGGGGVIIGNTGGVAGAVTVGAGGVLTSVVPVNSSIEPLINGNLMIQKGGLVSGALGVNGNVVNAGQQTLGDDPATIVVNGSYTLAPTGVLIAEVGPTSSSQLLVSGAVTLDGGTLKITSFDGAPLLVGQHYDFIQASGGITGAFDQIVTPNGFVDFSSSLTGGDLVLTAEHVAGSFAATAATANEHAVAAALDTAATQMAPGLMPLIDTLSNQTSIAAATWDQLSPEGLVSGENAMFEAQRGFDQLVASAAAPSGTPDAAPIDAGAVGAGRIWFSGFGGYADIGNDAGEGIAGASTVDSGFSVGADYRSGAGRVGLAVGPSWDSYEVAGRFTHGQITGVHASLYGGVSSGALYASGVVSYANFDDKSTRQVAAAGMAGQLDSSVRSDLFGGRLEVGWRGRAAGLELTPYAAVEGADISFARATEVAPLSAAAAALTLPPQRQGEGEVLAGVKADDRLMIGQTQVTPYLDVAYVHVFDARRTLIAAFAGAPTDAFSVTGASSGSDGAQVALGFDSRLNARAHVFAQVRTDQAERYQATSGQVGFLVSW